MRRLVLIALAGCSGTKVIPPDAGGDVPDPSPIDLSQWQAAGINPDAGTVSFVAELTKANLGESADLDGDGVRELQVLTKPDGTREWSWAEDGVRPSFRIEKFPDGLLRYTYWYSNYAAVREIDEYRPGQRVTVIDDNVDFKLDRRLTQTPYDAGFVQLVSEVDGGAGWTEVDRWISPTSLDQEVRRDALCDGNGNFPDEERGNGPIIGFSTDPGVACTQDERNSLMKAFDCAKRDMDGCLKEMNPTLRNEIIAHLVSGRLVLGCGNGCDRKYASTLAATDSAAAKMNWNRSLWDENKLCTLMLHELTHTAEVGFDSDHNSGHDRTYSCSNYCGGCMNVGPYDSSNAPDSMNVNCARCAETPSERRKCGIKEMKVTGTCVTNYSLCHAGLAGNMNCATCGDIQTNDCLGNEVLPERFDCCASCPPNYNNTDKPCPSSVTPMDSCGTPPPYCR